MATRALTAMRSGARSRAWVPRRTFHPRRTGAGKTASRLLSTATATPSSACSDASRTSVESQPDMTASPLTSSPPSVSSLQSATGYESGASTGAQAILDPIRKRWPWLKHLFADGAYDRRQLMDKAAFKDFVIEIVRRIDDDPGFKVLPRRWVVERTFGWITRWRRLVRDYEKRIRVF